MVYSSIIRPLLFHLEPERAHHLALRALRLLGCCHPVASVVRRSVVPRARSSIRALGVVFPSPLGVAAGFDKDGTALWGLFSLGFGFIEVGSVTLHSWPGNPAPRVFRFPRDGAIINRMGLPSRGAARVAAALRDRPPIPILINVAKTADPSILGDAAILDICECASTMAPHADALVLNLSCPNTEDGRTFQEPTALRELLQAIARRGPLARPLLAKISPDLDLAALEALVEEAMRGGVAGFVATNTTQRREGISLQAGGPLPSGGLSGIPLRERALDVVRAIRAQVGPAATVIACGGIRTAEDIARFREAGADLMEAYTGFIYEGPGLCRSAMGSVPQRP